MHTADECTCNSSSSKQQTERKMFNLETTETIICRQVKSSVDWLQSLKQIFINVSYHILVATLNLIDQF